MTILDRLVASARERVAADKAHVGAQAMREMAAQGGAANGKAFWAALQRPGLSFICEVKRASPSKGLIAPHFPYLGIARSYESAGADALSCLTEPKWFLGSDEIFTQIRQSVRLPMLRKDFTIDLYQIDQAKVMGANAVLLICAVLSPIELAKALERCDELGLSALVEAHDEAEIRVAADAGAKIIGVNNRNLKDFSVDFERAARLREAIPPEALFVAESGVTSPQDVATLSRIGADAVLVGEALMRAPDKAAMLAAMREAAR